MSKKVRQFWWIHRKRSICRKSGRPAISVDSVIHRIHTFCRKSRRPANRSFLVNSPDVHWLPDLFPWRRLGTQASIKSLGGFYVALIQPLALPLVLPLALPLAFRYMWNISFSFGSEKAMQCKAKQCNAKQSNVMQSKTMQSKAMQSKAMRSKAKQCNAKQSNCL